MKSNTSARRSFLRLIGGVVAGGAGAAALGSSASAQGNSTQPGGSTDGAGVDACAIFCTVVCCNCCESGGVLRHLWRCVAGPCGYTFYQCENNRPCSSYCLSPNAC